jgi:hypothetical protein
MTIRTVDQIEVNLIIFPILQYSITPLLQVVSSLLGE